ncbi:GNAT family N-acetyltransferase [Metaplanococcus flavidus]|uniref:Lipid II:glycine glycyltransferase n=1 Tax=Metaplanococcus flavidus TaxID=569883 RepID=A0ABW3L9M8_9BACL
MKDIYFEKDYGKLYEVIEEGKCEVFEFHHSLGTIRHMYIKREIPIQLSDETYYDLVTPYGYGGPIIITGEQEDKPLLTAEFQNAFQKHCDEQRIVSEFIRFHPFISNAEDFSKIYNISFRRNTTGTNLKDFENPVQEEFSKSARMNIKQALKAGLTYRVTVNPESLDAFQELYYSTMKRNQADAIYYFDETYFSDCLKYFSKNILLVEAIYENQVIGMTLNFIYKNTIHIHLGGTLEKFLPLSPVYLMLYGLTVWGKENGIDLIHSGGGRTSDLNDKLYLFKKRFGKNTEFNYFVGYKVWNEKIYEQLKEAAQVYSETEFFPAYRRKNNF